MTIAFASEAEVQAGPAMSPRYRRLEADRLVPAEPAGRPLGVVGDLQRRLVLGDQPLDPGLLAVRLLDVEVDTLEVDRFVVFADRDVCAPGDAQSGHADVQLVPVLGSGLHEPMLLHLPPTRRI
jgi:hypothetical protein